MEKEYLNFNRTVIHEYILPQFRGDFDKNLESYINKTTKKNYFNYINFDKFTDFLKNYYEEIIQIIYSRCEKTPKLIIKVCFDEKLKETYLDVNLSCERYTILNDRLYQFYTVKGKEYEIQNGKLCEFDKKYFDFLNNSSKTHGDNTYKQAYLEYNKVLLQKEYEKRLNNFQELAK